MFSFFVDVNDIIENIDGGLLPCEPKYVVGKNDIDQTNILFSISKMSNIQRARRIPNANGQVLIENWVEERATEHIDHRLDPPNTNKKTSPLVAPIPLKKSSHTALLTQHYQDSLNDGTVYRDSYEKFGPFDQVEQGARRKRLEHALTRQVAAEFNARKQEHEEMLRQERISDSTSEYRLQYAKEFESKPPPATQVS